MTQETQSANCDCQKATVSEEKKDVEAVVVFHQATDIFMLSTEQKDFEGTTYSIGKNILVPCDSLPAQYQQARTKVIVSYKRKDCYGAITDPDLRTNYGYFVELTSIGVKP